MSSGKWQPSCLGLNVLTHSGLVMPYILVNTRLLFDCTKPLPQPILTYQESGLMAFIRGQFYRKNLKANELMTKKHRVVLVARKTFVCTYWLCKGKHWQIWRNISQWWWFQILVLWTQPFHEPLIGNESAFRPWLQINEKPLPGPRMNEDIFVSNPLIEHIYVLMLCSSIQHCWCFTFQICKLWQLQHFYQNITWNCMLMITERHRSDFALSDTSYFDIKDKLCDKQSTML